jgi:Kef-type K+ transport system membrane component KefB
MDPALMKGRPLRNAALGWVVTFCLAAAAAVLLVFSGLARSVPLTALAMTSTAIGLLIPVLRDSHLMKPPYGPMILAAGAVGEAAPLFILPLVLAHQGGAGPQALVMAAFAGGAALAIVVSAHFSRGAFAAILERTMTTSGQFPMRLALCLLIFLILLSQHLAIDLVLGAFVAGAVIRAAVPDHQHEAMAIRFDGIGSAFLTPVFFLASGMRLDVTSVLADPVASAMIVVFALLMLIVRGAPALMFYSQDLRPNEAFGLALHSGTQLGLVVAIVGIAVQRGHMPSVEGASLVGGAVVTVLLFPALAARALQKPEP